MESDEGTDCSSVSEKTTTMDTSCGGSCEEAGSKLETTVSMKKQNDKPSMVNGVLFNVENHCNGDGSHGNSSHSDIDEDKSSGGRPPDDNDDDSDECRILSDNENKQDIMNNDDVDSKEVDGDKPSHDVISDISSPHQYDDIEENSLQSARDERIEGKTSSDKTSSDQARHQVTKDESNIPSVEATSDVCSDKDTCERGSTPSEKGISDFFIDKHGKNSSSAKAANDVHSDKYNCNEGSTPVKKAASDLCSDKHGTNKGNPPSSKAANDVGSDKDISERGSMPSEKATSDLCSDKHGTDKGNSPSSKAANDVCSDTDISKRGSTPSEKATGDLCSDKNGTKKGNPSSATAANDVCSDKDTSERGSTPSEKATSDLCSDKHGTNKGNPSSAKATNDVCSDKDISERGSTPSEKATSDLCSDEHGTNKGNPSSAKVASDVHSDKDDSNESSTPLKKATSDLCSDKHTGNPLSANAANDVCIDKDASNEGSTPLKKITSDLCCDKHATDDSPPSAKPDNNICSDQNTSDDINLSNNKTTPLSRIRTCKSCLEHDMVTGVKVSAGEDNQFECQKCQELSANSVSHTSDEANKEQCPMCNKVFESSEELDDHLLSPESCKKNEENLSSLNTTAKDVLPLSPALSDKPLPSVVSDKPLSPTLSDKPSESDTEDNNNDNACTFSAHKIQSLTLDGSVVDEMEDRDQELQRLSEEAESMDEALIEENDAEGDFDDIETIESSEPMETENTSPDVDNSRTEGDPGSSSQNKDHQVQTSKDDKSKLSQQGTENKNIKSDVKNDKEDSVEEDTKKVVDQVFVSKDSHPQIQPEIVCHEIAEPPVPVAAIPANREPEIVQEKHAEKKEPTPVPTAIKPVLTQPFTANKAARLQSKDDVVDITDSDKAASDKTSAKSGDGKSECEKTKNEERSKSPSGIKRRFSTGNETLDQDIVEMLQDSTKSSVRVTRSMRKPKEDPAKAKDAAKGASDDKKSASKAQTGKPSTKETESEKNKPNSSDAMEIKDPLQSNNGSLVLQVPATSVQSGAKLIITIPENNSTNTPPGRYLITVPPANTSLSPSDKQQVVLKASPLSPTSPTVNDKSPQFKETCTKFTAEKQQSPAEKSSQMETEATQVLQLKKTMLVAKQTKKVYVKELEEMYNVIFECSKCKLGFPNLLLVQLHMEDCCHHPPTQKPSLHMRIPTEILLKFFDKEPSTNRENFKCVCCQEILSFRRYRIGKYYPSLASHFSKHTCPSVRVVNYTEQSVVRKFTDALTIHSKQAVEWVDHMVPPFSCSNQPVSSKTGMLDGFLCTSNKLHQESLLLLEYDSDELDEEIYSMRKKKETKKKKKKGKNAGRDDVYVCNWKSAIVKEDHNIVEVTEIGTPKSAFPGNELNRSGSLKHSILQSPSKAHSQRLKDSNQKSGKKRKSKTRKEVTKQLFTEDNINRRRSPRKGGVDPVILSLPEKRPRTPRKAASSEDDIILISSEDEEKESQSKEKEVQKKRNIGANSTPVKSKPATPAARLMRQGSIDDESSRGSFSSTPEPSAERADALKQSVVAQGDIERPPSRGSSIICISDSNEEEENSTVRRNENMPKMPDRSLSKAKNMIPQAKTSTTIQKAASPLDAAKGNKQTIKCVNESGDKNKEVRKRLVPEADKDEDEVMVLSDREEDEEEDGVDLNSDNYDPILLDKHQVKTYFQMSKEEQGIYECSLGGCSSCDCVAESDLFEHLCQHIHVERVHPQKRSKTILFKGRVVPQYLKLTKHQIWAHFCSNIVVDSEMEICDEYMQQYKQCRWGNCKQRVWTKYGRLSHHLRSHLRFTQIDTKRYQKMREMRKIASSNTDKTHHPILENISKPKTVPIESTRKRLNDGDEVICLPEDMILQKYKFGKSPSKNVRGIFSCLSCTFSYHLDSNASAVMTVKRLACHLKQHLPQSLSQNHQCLITPKAMKRSTNAEAYAKSIRMSLVTTNQDLDNMRFLPDGIIASCFDLMKMKVVEPAEDDGPILNKDSVLYRCLYSGCLIGVAGDKKSALLKHIKEHKPAVSDVGRQLPPGQNKGLPNRQNKINQGPQASPSSNDTANRKRKPSPNRTSDRTIQQLGSQSKQRRISDAMQDTTGNQADRPSVVDDDDDDVVEVIEVSSQDSNQLYTFDEQNVDSSSQDSVVNISESPSPSVSGQNENNLQSSELPEWTANNRGINSVTGIEPSRSNPSRNMDELRQIPNDVIVCSMPDVEAFFCEHIVKYCSFMPSLSDKVTFGKPCYSCPECGENGLRGVALKQHLENHIGKTIKWKALIKSPPRTSESETELDSPVKYKTNVKNSVMERVLLPSKMRLNPRKLDPRSGINSKHQVKMVGQGVQKARQGFKSVLGRIMQRERNIRWGKSARSPVKRVVQYSAGNYGRNEQSNAPIKNLTHDLSSQVNQGQSSTIENAETNKQFQNAMGSTQHSLNPSAVTNQSYNPSMGINQSHNEHVGMEQSHNAVVGESQQSHTAGQSQNPLPVKQHSFSHAAALHRSPKRIQITQVPCSPQGGNSHSPMGGNSHIPKGASLSNQVNHSNSSQPCEVIDLIDDDPIEIGSVGSEDVDMENMSENEQNDKHPGAGSDEPHGDDLFLTIDDILRDHFIKEEKQKSRKGINGMNFVVVKYKCRRCAYATLTVLDVPEHVAFHIKRKVILKIKMDK